MYKVKVQRKHTVRESTDSYAVLTLVNWSGREKVRAPVRHPVDVNNSGTSRFTAHGSRGRTNCDVSTLISQTLHTAPRSSAPLGGGAQEVESWEEDFTFVLESFSFCFVS